MAGLADNFLFNPLLRQPLLGAEDSYDKLFASITVTPSKFDISSNCCGGRAAPGEVESSSFPPIPLSNVEQQWGPEQFASWSLLWSQPTIPHRYPTRAGPTSAGFFSWQAYLGSSQAWMKLRLCQFLARMCLCLASEANRRRAQECGVERGGDSVKPITCCLI
jgi:hypothetical protein